MRLEVHGSAFSLRNLWVYLLLPILSAFDMLYIVFESSRDRGVAMDLMNLKIVISPDVIFQEVQLGESLLLNVKTLVYYAFDPLGTRFWNALRVSSDADEALRLVATTSDWPLSELQSKFRAILSGLERSGLITLENARSDATEH
jgi:hypothetical protein